MTAAYKFATAYLWEEIWAKDSVLDLIEHFVHEIAVEDDKGRKTGERRLIFPRYHQLDAVRRLVLDARTTGPGQRHLIQHSAGSGKSFTIAWLAHQLSTLHDAEDRRVFDSIVVVTDRRVLDRQLQRTIRQFEQTLGVVENMAAFACPHCKEVSEIFDRGGGRRVAEELDVPFLGKIPIDPAIRAGGDRGVPSVIAHPEAAATAAFHEAARMLAGRVSQLHLAGRVAFRQQLPVVK